MFYVCQSDHVKCLENASLVLSLSFSPSSPSPRPLTYIKLSGEIKGKDQEYRSFNIIVLISLMERVRHKNITQSHSRVSENAYVTLWRSLGIPPPPLVFYIKNDVH
jgi:hypothetical protein